MILIISGFILTFGAIMTVKVFVFTKKSDEHMHSSYEKIESLFYRLAKDEPLDQEEIYSFASDVSTRIATYQILLEYDKLEYFPTEYYTIEKSAESNLVYWLEFPTELYATPDEIEHVEKVTIDSDSSKTTYYHVFRFRVSEPHWAARDGWKLGVVGPYNQKSKPYDFPVVIQSRLHEKTGDITPGEEVQWVHDNIAIKKLISAYKNKY